jgi:hypothetical protein
MLNFRLWAKYSWYCLGMGCWLFIMGKKLHRKMGSFFIQIVVWVCTRVWVLVYPSELSLFNPGTLWNYKLWLYFNIARTIWWGFEREHLCILIPTNLGIAEFFPQKHFILVPMPAHLGKVTWQQNLVILPSNPFFLGGSRWYLS